MRVPSCLLPLSWTATMLAVAANAAIDLTDLLDRKTLFGNPEKIRGRISPDGTTMSWLAPSANGVLNVWVAPVGEDGGMDEDEARLISNSKTRTPGGYFWSADSRYILYTLDKGGNENTHLYATDVQTGEERDLTPTDDDGVKAKIQAFSYRHPSKIVVGMNDRNRQLFDLYTVTIETGDKELLIQNDAEYGAWLLDKNYDIRGSIKQQADGSSVVFKRAENGTFEDFFDIPSEDSITTNWLQFGGDDETLYMVDSRGRDKAALMAVNFTSGERTVVADSDKADVSDVTFDPVTAEPLAYLVNYLKPDWIALNGDYDLALSAVKAKFGNDASILSSTTDGTKYVIAADSPTFPLVYFLYDKTTGEFVEMFKARPSLDASLLQPMQAFEVTSRDGLNLTTYLTLPSGSDSNGDGIPESPLPMVLTVHGGPWARDWYMFNPKHQWLANRGYAVMSVNYRGSTGFGKDFINAAIKEFAGKMHDDLLDAVQYAIDNGIADPQKVAIMGGSYGGYATLVGLTFSPDTFACGVDIVGVSSLVTVIESFPAYWAPFLAGSWYKFVGNPANETERADMLARSPITRTDDITKPLLIGQGENDPRVTKLESDQMVEAMSERGQVVTYVNYPDEGHGFGREENRLSFYAITENFLQPCLGGRSEDYNDSFSGSSLEVLHGAEYVPLLPETLDASSPLPPGLPERPRSFAEDSSSAARGVYAFHMLAYSVLVGSVLARLL